MESKRRRGGERSRRERERGGGGAEREGEERERSEREKGGGEPRKLERWLLKQIERKTDTRVVEEARVTPRRQ